MEEIDKIFKNDISEKKRNAQHNRSKTGRGMSKSRRAGMLPIDRMSKKELREYTKAGEVMVSYMYDTIITREEFEKKPLEEQSKIMNRWRELYPNNKIMSEMGIKGNNTFYGMLKNLDVPQKVRGGFKGRKKITDKKLSTSNILPAPTTVAQQEMVQKLLTKGLHLEYNGNYDAEQLEKVFTKLQLIVSGEESKFRLSILLDEIE